MTTQMPDEVRYDGTVYVVTAVEGAGLFDPYDHGLEVQSLHTACWRGFICRYAVAGGNLVLDTLGVGANERPPPLNGVPVDAERTSHRGWQYQGLNLPVPFTGRLLLGNGYLRDSPYLHMGFWPAWFYETVQELGFQEGRLTAAHDRSADLAAVRERLGRGDVGPASDDETRGWIARTFSLSFDYSWPGSRD